MKTAWGRIQEYLERMALEMDQETWHKESDTTEAI